MTMISKSRAMSALKIAFLSAAVMSAGVAPAQIKLTPIERTGAATGPAVEPPQAAAPAAAPAEAPVKKVAAKPCKKKKGGLGGLIGAVKKTGLAGTLTNQALGGGMGGYAAGRVADVAVDEGAKAEQEAAKAPKTDC